MLAKVDVNANQELALRYQVQGIPAVKAFRNGHVVDEFVGVQAPVAVARFLAFELLLRRFRRSRASDASGCSD